jgi:5'-deoxynucleotidase YfbR-like HD superfamily hydrolase
VSMATDPGWHRGDWMQTFTGRKFYPLAPEPEDVDPVDVAHALSMLCRYAGHVDRFYSVAEHCVLLSWWARAQGHDETVQLEMLLHDATEAYVVDVPRPLKINLPDYQQAEAGVELAVWERFGLPMRAGADRVFRPEVSPLVKEADTRILLDERAALMAATVHAWGIDSLAPLDVEVEGWLPARAEQEYLNRLEELGALR